MKMSRRQIRRRRTLKEIDQEIERLFRRLNLNDVLPGLWFHFLLESLPRLLPGFKVVTVSTFKFGMNAQAESTSNTIRIDMDTWRAALRGEPHAKTIFFHELGHLILGHTGVNPDVTGRDVRNIRDENARLNEWEAKRFSAAIQIPAHLVFGTPTEGELRNRFGVGAETARIRVVDLDLQSAKGADGRRKIPDPLQKQIDEMRSQAAPAKIETSPKGIIRGKHYSAERRISLRHAFVSMPFRPDTDRLYEHILKPALSSCGLVPVRGDHTSRPGTIIGQVIESISACELFLAEISDLNPNVMNEIGMAQILGIEPIIVCREGTALPFNVRHLRCIFYENTVAIGPELAERIKRAVRAALAK